MKPDKDWSKVKMEVAPVTPSDLKRGRPSGFCFDEARPYLESLRPIGGKDATSLDIEFPANLGMDERSARMRAIRATLYNKQKRIAWFPERHWSVWADRTNPQKIRIGWTPRKVQK